jgi:hypothetical protein
MVVGKRSDGSIGTQPEEEENVSASVYRNIGIIRRLSTTELWFRNERLEAKALIKRRVG